MKITYTNETIKVKHAKDLLLAQTNGYKINVIIIGVKECSKCGKELPKKDLNYEIKHQRLPFKNCPRVRRGYKFCAACYAFEII